MKKFSLLSLTFFLPLVVLFFKVGKVKSTETETGADYLRWLSLLKYCTANQTCGVTSVQKCSFTNNQKNKITSPSVVLQTHRGSSKFSTYVLSEDGYIMDVVNDNTTTVIPLESISNKKLIFTNTLLPPTYNFSTVICPSIYHTNIFPLSPSPEKKFLFCLDFTPKSEASDCDVNFVQIAAMATQLETMEKIKNKINKDIINQLQNQFNNYVNSGYHDCLVNATSGTSGQCNLKKNLIDNDNSAEFLKCVEKYQHDSCFDFQNVYNNISQSIINDSYTTVRNTYNISTNDTVPDRLTMSKLSKQLLKVSKPGVILASFSTYHGFQSTFSASCEAGLSNAAGKCALIAIAGAVGSEVILNGITYGQAAFQNSIVYATHCTPESTAIECVNQTQLGQLSPPDFTTTIKETQISIAVFASASTLSSVAGCIVGSVGNLVVCKFKARKSKTPEEQQQEETEYDEPFEADYRDLPSFPTENSGEFSGTYEYPFDLYTPINLQTRERDNTYETVNRPLQERLESARFEDTQSFVGANTETDGLTEARVVEIQHQSGTIEVSDGLSTSQARSFEQDLPDYSTPFEAGISDVGQRFRNLFSEHAPQLKSEIQQQRIKIQYEEQQRIAEEGNTVANGETPAETIDTDLETEIIDSLL